MQLTLNQWLVSEQIEPRNCVSQDYCAQIAASVYATSDEERVEVTYGQYLNVMCALTGTD